MKQKLTHELGTALLLGSSIIVSAWILESSGHHGSLIPFFGVLSWVILQMGHKNKPEHCCKT